MSDAKGLSRQQMCDRLAMEFQDESWHVDEVGSGSEAVRRIDVADPDVVVIDYRMPEMDGLDTAREIKDKRPGQLMVLYTAFIDDELQRKADEAGVAVCLGKVEGLASLEREISRLCTSLF